MISADMNEAIVEILYEMSQCCEYANSLSDECPMIPKVSEQWNNLRTIYGEQKRRIIQLYVGIDIDQTSPLARMCVDPVIDKLNEKKLPISFPGISHEPCFRCVDLDEFDELFESADVSYMLRALKESQRNIRELDELSLVPGSHDIFVQQQDHAMRIMSSFDSELRRTVLFETNTRVANSAQEVELLQEPLREMIVRTRFE